MAMSAVPFALQNATHNANLFRQAMSSLVPPGGGLVTPGDFTVTQTGTPSMAVIVGVGRIWIPGTEVANVTGGNFSSQAMYYAENESADTRTVAAADPTNPRIDVVYAYVKDQQYSGTSNLADYAVATGTPTPGASYPTNAPTLPNDAVALAWIYVGNGVASILNANITQILTHYMQPLPVLHSEWTFNQTGIPSTTVWGAGSLTNDAANTTDTGFVTTPGTDRLTIRDAGEYAIHLVGSWGTATTGRAFSQIGDGGSNSWSRTNAVVGENLVSTNIPNFRCGANTTIFLTTYLTITGTTTWAGRVRITRIR